MSDELQQALAEQLVGENKRLTIENQELTSVNESMSEAMRRIEALGGLDAIEASMSTINESKGHEDIVESYTRLIENFGSQDLIEESLSTVRTFTEKHGSFENIEEALNASHATLQTLKDFQDQYGPLSEVSESLNQIEDRLPRIRDSLEELNEAKAFQEKFGSFAQIEEALNKSFAILRHHQRLREVRELDSVCESYGLTVVRAKDLMRKHKVKLNGLVDLCESFGMKKAEDKGTTDINENKQKGPRYGRGDLTRVMTGEKFLNSGAAVDIDESKKTEGTNKPSAFRDKTRLQRMIGS